ncbi:MAG: hypothetical protein COA57_01060 [Flavobacteriales bacterium]|nr:MAG: hypothetical protein COA57_01060 [Flavobacteriales bacterium]
MRRCPVCDSVEWDKFFATHTDRIMTGDQRIGSGNLNKIICKNCGTVANKDPFTNEELELLYGKEYELNTLGREEHLFFTKNGPVARSQVFCDWIQPHFPKQFETLIEIGCGEGRLLEKIKKSFSNKNIKGFDGSHKAVTLGKAKGLNITQKLILTEKDAVPNSDVILLINVIEHIENIPGIIKTLIEALTERGRIIFCLPIQDYGGYDLVFAEHVWHFTVNHIIALLHKNGLRVIHAESNHPINHGIGLFVCEKGITKNIPTPKEHRTQKNTINFWKSRFEKLNDWLINQKFEKIAVFGSGEVFTLFLTFTSLGDQNIVACIDETPSKIGTKKHGIPIYNIDWLEANVVEAVFLAINSKYYEQVENKLKQYDVGIYPLIS